ncbi:MAG: hypothetical protein GY757_46030 [bacterium]|nr:hypothetical protein [bacterium]
MHTQNPFERKKPKQDVYFRGRVWYADEKGKDEGNTPLPIVIGPEYIWFSRDFSIPLAWVTNVQAQGSGFYLEWKNELNGESEGNIFCVRTFFGYNTEKRDEIIEAVREARQHCLSMGQTAETAAAIPKVCEKCQAEDAGLYDFLRVFSYAFNYSVTTKRIVLCKRHGGSAFFKYYFLNLFFGFFGIWGVIGYGNWNNAKMLYQNQAITSGRLLFYKSLALLPLALLLTLIMWAIFSA